MWDESCAIVADDHELFGAALKTLLQRDLHVAEVNLALSYDDAMMQLSESARVDLLTLDLAMPGMNGGASIEEIRRRFGAIKTIIVSANASRTQVLDALSWGIHGYLPKTLSRERFVHAFRQVLQGHIYVPTALSESVGISVQHVSAAVPAANHRADAAVHVSNHPPAIASHDARLSERQREVLDLLTLGQSNKQIARTLGLAEGTVKVHINGLYRALNVHNRAGAVASWVIGDTVGLSRDAQRS